ncbi:hypothetical protein FRC01_009690 [Tulasnella sp. 417]|nr:hypothetical protein FRC01_009690 [Tulasnella sp. 417]
MPKAVSTQPNSSPTKRSPTKPAYRRNVAGDFSVPHGTSRSSLPSDSQTRPSRTVASRPRDPSHGTTGNGRRILVFDNLPKGSSREALWLADDIFASTKGSRVGTSTPEFEFQPPQQIDHGQDDFPDMKDFEKALDEATIDKGLEQIPATPEPDNAHSTTAEKPLLRTEFLPFMFAAKAPRRLPLRCSNHPQCAKPTQGTSTKSGYFRCKQCFGHPLLCGACLVHSHRHSPFHWPEQWVDETHTSNKIPEFWNKSRPANYGYFKRISLLEVGLHVGLGHEGALCPMSHPRDYVDLTVLHKTGQHVARFRPCVCSGKELWEQLLEVDIWPSTQKRPKTGFTMEVLRHQRCLSLRSKTNLKEYYDTLVDLTSAAEDKASVPYAYDQLRVGYREHRALETHMRAGRPDATAPLAPGELCVACPSCPHPGVNLPHNWERDPLKQLRYAQFLSGDGNFKLQHLSKHSTSAQSSLFGDGGFWVPDSVFSRYLSSTSPAADEPKGQQRSACNTMAGDPGSSPESGKTFDVSGIFCVSCRHIFICPNGVVDLHKGEKYRYADACFAGPLNASYSAGLRYFVITYDIACKYGIKFKSRCCNKDCKFVLIPTPSGDINIIFCVNKFHQESHDDNCAAKNALDYTKYVGRTCGEGVETVWANMNWLRYSTREMGTGARIETLSDHFNDWNWQKTLAINSYAKAVESLDIVMQDLDELEASIGVETASKLRADYETAGGEQFLQDTAQLTWPSRKDLMTTMQEVDPTSTTLSAAFGTDGINVAQINLICKALVLETMQAKLCQRAHDLAILANPPTTLKDRVKRLMDMVKTALQEHHERLFDVAPQLEHLARAPASPAKDEILLPSRLSSEDILHYSLTTLRDTEDQLHVCHAYDIIRELRSALGRQSYWTRHVQAQPSSESTKTKGQSNLQASVACVRETAYAYKVCYDWLVNKSTHMAKKFGLRPLKATDLVLLSTWRKRKGYKRAKDRLPWIWTLRPVQFPGLSEDPFDDEVEVEQDEEVEETDMEMEAPDPESQSNSLEDVIENWRNEFVRLEFVHTLAAVERWTEEVDILKREMPATCRSLRHSALVWAQRANERGAKYAAEVQGVDWVAADPSVRGYIAYASRKFDLYARLTTDALRSFADVVGSDDWEDIWLSPREKDLVPDSGPILKSSD